MTQITLRARLLGGAVLGATLSALMPTQAFAQCALVGSDRVCTGTQTTVDGDSAVDPTVRNLTYISANGVTNDSVAAGAVVDGFGLAAVDTSVGTGAYSFTNNGTVEVDVGNTPTGGGNAAAVFLRSQNAPLTYSGSGDIFNFGTGSGLDVRTSGVLDIDVGGTIGSTTGRAINAIGGGGLVDITTTAGETLWSQSEAIYAQNAGAGDIVIRSNADISSAPGLPNTFDSGIYAVLSGGTGNISLTVNGDVGAVGDRAAFGGVEGRILTPGSLGSVLINGAGSIYSTTDSIRLENTGDGLVQVQFVGSVDSSTGVGIRTIANNGDISIVTGGGTIAGATAGIFASATGIGGINIITGSGAVTSSAGNGIQTSTVSGNQLIDLSGNVIATGGNGVQAASSGGGTIVVNVNGGNVSGTTDGIDLSSTGSMTVAVGAGRTVTGAVNAIDFNSSGAGLVNNSGTVGTINQIAVFSDFANASITVNNLAGATLNGRVDLSNNADTITNAGTWNMTGANNFYDGADVVNNQSGGTISLAGDASLTGLETFTQNGLLALNTFTLTGPAIAFVNGGTVDTNGSAGFAGFTSVTNNGTFDLAAGTFTAPAGVFTNNGRLVTDEGVSSMTGQTSFVMGAAGVIDLQDGATGDQLTIASAYTGGGSLQVDVSQTAADRLILTGAISGVTAVDLNVVGTTFLGINQLVVDATNASTDAFVTGNIAGTLNPLLTYGIVQDGNDYFVGAAPNAGAFEPLAVSNLAADFWYQSGYEVMAQTRIPVVTEGFGVWGQIYGSIEKSGETDAQVINGETYDADNKLDTDRYGIQAGVDFGFAGARVGLTGGWGRAESKTGGANYKIDGWNIGLYGQVGGELGFHGEALVKYDRFDVDFEDGFFAGNDTDGHSWGGDLALGYRFQAGLVPILDVNVGLSHVRTKVDGITDFGFGYDYDTITSTRARGGVRAYFGGGWRPYLDLSAHHEFDGDGSVALFDGANVYDLRSSGKGTWFRLEGGLAGQPNKGPMLAAWAEAGDRKGAGIRLGFRFGGAAREVLPPPPPPPMVEPVAPPPPPPATQTCADGTVILATEACPPPPPPPPPAAEPERG